jgi:hypothetical protein
MDEPSAKGRLKTTLEMVPDYLDDDVHARLDKDVFAITDTKPSTLPLATLLLATIVSTSEGRLPPRSTASKLCDDSWSEHVAQSASGVDG